MVDTTLHQPSATVKDAGGELGSCMMTVEGSWCRATGMASDSCLVLHAPTSSQRSDLVKEWWRENGRDLVMSSCQSATSRGRGGGGRSGHASIPVCWRSSCASSPLSCKMMTRILSAAFGALVWADGTDLEFVVIFWGLL